MLREYQENIINNIKENLQHGIKRQLTVLPTGAGKTKIASKITMDACKKGNRVLFLVHRNELLDQASKEFSRSNILHGIVSAGSSITKSQVNIASVQSMVNRTALISHPHVIFTDEAHRSVSSSYERIYAAYPNAILLGLTATPQRTDGRPLGDIYDKLVKGIEIPELIAMGHLSGYRLYSPPSRMNEFKKEKAFGDYKRNVLERETNKPYISGDAADHYIRYARSKKAIVFCATVAHAKSVAEMYNLKGIKAEQLDGTNTKRQRIDVIYRFRSGEIDVLTSVDLFLEGLDIPSIEVVQWLRKTSSLIVWRQGNGRGLRPCPNKEHLIILDHVGNALDDDLGMPDDIVEWSLEGRAQLKKEKDEEESGVKIKRCGHCYNVDKAEARHCSACGKEYFTKSDSPRPYEIRKDEELVEIAKKSTAPKSEFKKQRAKLKGLEELVIFGIRRNMKNPSGWAAHVMASRDKSLKLPDIKRHAKEIEAKARV